VMWRTRSFSKGVKEHYSRGKLTKGRKSLGDWSDGGTPGHIPNPVVKAVSADGTWGATPWESRSSPRDFFLKNSGIVENVIAWP
jgi:hypothetical protein